MALDYTRNRLDVFQRHAPGTVDHEEPLTGRRSADDRSLGVGRIFAAAIATKEEPAMRVEIHTRRLAGAIVAALAASVLIATPALAQQKTVKQCTDEWRANKDANQAKNILLKDYVTQCRAGTAAAPAAAPAAQTKPAAAPAAPQKTVKQCTDAWRANKD